MLEAYRYIRIVRELGPVGAEVAGVDLSEPLTQAVCTEIYQAWLCHGLLCFRDQHLAPARQADFAALFGRLDVYPFMQPSECHAHVVDLIKEAGSRTNFGGLWHTDTSYLQEPPKATVLYAVEVPEVGGDTLFADARAAWDDLSPGFQRLLGPLRGIFSPALVHGAGGAYADSRARTDLGERYAVDAESAASEVVHPLIRSHSETGRRSIYASLAHTLRIEGMTREESLPLLTQLAEHATRECYVTRLQWTPGTVAIWDNRCLFHFALNDYQGSRRHVRRVIVAGERPV